jgi:Ner family transcriptional regulator
VNTNRDPEVIKAQLRMRGKTLSGIAARARPPISRPSICAALTRPYALGESLIARALGEEAKNIWPSRYDEQGWRRKRIPLSQYRPTPRFQRGGREK